MSSSDDDEVGLATKPGKDAAETGALLAKLGDYCTTLAAKLTALRAERGELLEEKLALGKAKGDAKRKTEITERIDNIAAS